MPKAATKAKTNKSAQTAPRGTSIDQSSSSPDNMPKAVTKKRGEKKGKKKDPNAPKRGLSAYMFYANQNRDRVRSENPDISFGQVGKVLGEEWKALEPPEKEKYEEMARKDKIRYEEEKAKYNAAEEDDEDSG